MSPDERALLAAARAAPADDTPRLVYADRLDDHGDPDRAAFIRCQVEAERLHPDSHRRAELDARAEALFAAHWVDWWGPVCAAVGLPLTERPRATRLGRLAQWAFVRSDGLPYNRRGFDLSFANTLPFQDTGGQAETGFGQAGYRRGFPDRLVLSGRLTRADRRPELVRLCAATAPLAELHLPASTPDDWGRLHGPHLAGVSRLVLRDTSGLIALVLSSPHLTGLTEFRLGTTGRPASLAREVVWVATSVAAPRLRRLDVPLPDDGTAVAMVAAGRLTGLTALAVELESEPGGGVAGPFPPENDRFRLETLARSPRLAGLTELHVSGVLSAAGVRALVHRPSWAGLRALRLTSLRGGDDWLDGLADATLTGLTDLRVKQPVLPAGLRTLARSPLLPRLRHLHVDFAAVGEDADILAVADALDPDRVETLAVRSVSMHAAGGWEAGLARRFGERVRLGDLRHRW